LTRNGKGYATKELPYLNVKPGKLDVYAMFLVDVLDHFQREGLRFDYLSPFNEPQWAWDDAGQEGTPALNVELYALIRYLSNELSKRKLATPLVIGEAGTIGHVFTNAESFGLKGEGRDSVAQFFFSPKSPFYIGDLPNVAPILSAHSYQSVWPLDKQVEYRQMLRDTLKVVNPKLGYWMSEYCILEKNDEIQGGNRRDLGMDTALFVARIIHNDLTIAQARSWQWWTAVSEVDYKDGLVYLDDGSEGETGRMGPRTASLMQDGTVRESKLLWVLGNYSRFVLPGMVRAKCVIDPEQIQASGVLVSAYKGPENNLVIVLVNLSREDQRCDLGLGEEFEVYTTNSKANLEKSVQNGSSIALPRRAVITCVRHSAPTN
jgi:O-glycosyl hydrolase